LKFVTKNLKVIFDFRHDRGNFGRVPSWRPVGARSGGGSERGGELGGGGLGGGAILRGGANDEGVRGGEGGSLARQRRFL